MLAITCLIIGIAAGLFINYHIPVQYTQYVAIAILAAMDSVFGGLVATFSKTFKLDIFIAGLFGNALLAAALVYIGKLLDVDLSLAAIIVFGARIFQNFSTIRRNLLNKLLKRDII